MTIYGHFGPERQIPGNGRRVGVRRYIVYVLPPGSLGAEFGSLRICRFASLLQAFDAGCTRTAN